MIFLTFLVTLPGLATSSRGFLKLAGYMAFVCSIFTLILGLILWLLTLRLKGDFAPLFSAQPERVKSLMQETVRSSSPPLPLPDHQSAG